MLQRYNPVSHNPLQWDPEMDECDDGEYYRAADVLAWRDSIRAAAGELIRRGEVYRAASCYHYASGDPAHAADERRREAGYHEAWATLDKLLADGGA